MWLEIQNNSPYSTATSIASMRAFILLPTTVSGMSEYSKQNFDTATSNNF